MKLIRINERVWYCPCEKERDRPNLGYIRGERFSVAVDAGHSDSHIAEFYAALKEADLPLPSLTVITHWHWDHTFGMHAVNGLCAANSRTAEHLADFREEIKGHEEERFLSLDESIRREYADGKPVIVTMPDIVFSDEMIIDAGNCPIRVFQAESPHTDDSSLIYLPDDKILFLGDCTSGAFPTWNRDPSLAKKLADTIERISPEICVYGHYTHLPTAEIIGDLLSEED